MSDNKNNNNQNSQKVSDSTHSRKVKLDGAKNFRDLGGYIGADNRLLRWGKVFRSGHLSALSTENNQQWDKLNIGLIVDLRTEYEREKSPSQIPTSSVTPQIKELNIDTGNTAQLLKDLQQKTLSPEWLQQVLVDVNQQFVDKQTHMFKQLFVYLTEFAASNNPHSLLFHCTAGKDRTGFSAALLLSALGVSQQQIMEDYLLTSKYYLPKQEYNWFIKRYGLTESLDVVSPLLEVREVYLNSAFAVIDQKFNGIDAYLTNQLGLTADKRSLLQSCFLEE